MWEMGGCIVDNVFCELFISLVRQKMGPNVTIKCQTLLLPALLELFPELQKSHLKEFMESDAHTQCSCVKTSVRLVRKKACFFSKFCSGIFPLDRIYHRSCCLCNGTLVDLTYGITSYLSTWGNHFEFVSHND